MGDEIDKRFRGAKVPHEEAIARANLMEDPNAMAHYNACNSRVPYVPIQQVSDAKKRKRDLTQDSDTTCPDCASDYTIGS